MESRAIDGLTLYFDPAENEAADLIGRACRRSVRLLQDTWGLQVPQDCRVYVMTSWPQFLRHATPWFWWPLLLVTFPLWAGRFSRVWPYAGGWAQQFGRRRTVGVKPPRLLASADRRMGERIFLPAEEEAKIEHVTCHELTHAFTAHLRLPMWLNEGLAMVTVDRYAGQPTVRSETLTALAQAARSTEPGRYRKLHSGDADVLVYHTVRGYWLTRYIRDVEPALLTTCLSRRLSHQALEAQVAESLGMPPETFWERIDPRVVAHFEGISGA